MKELRSLGAEKIIINTVDEIQKAWWTGGYVFSLGMV